MSTPENSQAPTVDPALEEAATLVRAVVRESQPESLAQLRALLADRTTARTRDLIEYVVLSMVNRKELELTTDRRLIAHVA